MVIFFPNQEKDKIDWFFHMADDTAKTPPMTWEKYPKGIIGSKAIVEMEYAELMKEIDKSESLSIKKKECVHLAAACYRLWKAICDEH